MLAYASLSLLVLRLLLRWPRPRRSSLARMPNSAVGTAATHPDCFAAASKRLCYARACHRHPYKPHLRAKSREFVSLCKLHAKQKQCERLLACAPSAVVTGRAITTWHYNVEVAYAHYLCMHASVGAIPVLVRYIANQMQRRKKVRVACVVHAV
eukprot:scaffold212257_cov31-Tisochrysis_lutea.AAC.1